MTTTFRTLPAHDTRGRAGGLHSTCYTHGRVWRLTCDEYEELREYAGHVCGICGKPDRYLNIDHEHEHELGLHAIRGLLCPSDNAGKMRRVDEGYHPVTEPVRQYLLRSWHLAKTGSALGYEPLIHLSVNALSSADRVELAELAGSRRYPNPSRVAALRPKFEHPEIAAHLEHGALRPVMRLICFWMWGRHDYDIGHPDGPTSRIAALGPFSPALALALGAVTC